jgi:hypothetical protein
MSVATGRFFGRDRLDGPLTIPASRNGYIYTYGNPVDNTDPSGDLTLSEVATTTAILSVLTSIQQPVIPWTLTRKYGKAEWTGKLFLASASAQALASSDPLYQLFSLAHSWSYGPAFGGILVQSKAGVPAPSYRAIEGQGLILGFSASFGLNFGVLESNFEATSPAFFGVNPSVFSGGFNMFSWGLSTPLGSLGDGGYFVSGFARGTLTTAASRVNLGNGISFFSGFTVVWGL